VAIPPPSPRRTVHVSSSTLFVSTAEGLSFHEDIGENIVSFSPYVFVICRPPPPQGQCFLSRYSNFFWLNCQSCLLPFRTASGFDSWTVTPSSRVVFSSTQKFSGQKFFLFISTKTCFLLPRQPPKSCGILCDDTGFSSPPIDTQGDHLSGPGRCNRLLLLSPNLFRSDPSSFPV